MTREEAIKYLSEEQEKTKEVVALTERDFKVSESVWHTEYEAFALAIAALREQPRWISVEERLPDKRGQYLTYEEWRYGCSIDMAYWTNSYRDEREVEMYGRALWYRYDSEYGDYEIRDITHWMPLPEPPEET